MYPGDKLPFKIGIQIKKKENQQIPQFLLVSEYLIQMWGQKEEIEPVVLIRSDVYDCSNSFLAAVPHLIPVSAEAVDTYVYTNWGIK